MARRPVDSPYTITTEFGEVDSYALFGRHSGVDYAVPLNRPVKAPTSGRVVSAAWSNTGGNMVVIYDGQFYHRLMHNNSFAVGTGQQVSEGQVVAYAGTTGLSTGVHCHWDINIRGITANAFSDFRDPATWLAGGYNVSTPQGGGTMVTDRAQLDRLYDAVLQRGRTPGEGEDVYLGKDSGWVFDDLYRSRERSIRLQNVANELNGLRQAIAERDAIVNDLRTQLQNNSGATKAELQKALDDVATLTAQYTQKQREYDELKTAYDKETADKEALAKEKDEAAKTGNAFIRWFTDVLTKLKG